MQFSLFIFALCVGGLKFIEERIVMNLYKSGQFSIFELTDWQESLTRRLQINSYEHETKSLNVILEDRNISSLPS